MAGFGRLRARCMMSVMSTCDPSQPAIVKGHGPYSNSCNSKGLSGAGVSRELRTAAVGSARTVRGKKGETDSLSVWD